MVDPIILLLISHPYVRILRSSLSLLLPAAVLDRTLETYIHRLVALSLNPAASPFSDGKQVAKRIAEDAEVRCVVLYGDCVAFFLHA